MRYHELARLLVKTTVALVFLAGCGAPAATPLPPTSTPVPATEMPPTSTPPVLITSADKLLGTWQPLSQSVDAMFLQFNSDGTCRHAYSLDELTGVPQVECTYTFKGTDLLTTAVKLHGVPECASPTARYEVQLMADNQIQLVPIRDTCGPRIRSTRGMYQRIP